MKNTKYGVDVSHIDVGSDGSGDIDMHAMTKNNPPIEWIALKATEGANFVDPTFESRRPRAVAMIKEKLFVASLLYHFFHPTDDVEAQATNYCNAVKSLGFNEFIALDVESTTGWDKVDPSDALVKIENLVYHIKTNLGVTEKMFKLYGSLGWFKGYFSEDQLTKLTFMSLWEARYANQLGSTDPWPVADIWQFSESATVQGVGNGTVDLDVWMNNIPTNE